MGISRGDILRSVCGITAILFSFVSSSQAADPIGYHDEGTCTLMRGWACDSDDFNAQLDIHFYDIPNNGAGVFVGATKANIKREAGVGAVCGGNQYHGFSWLVPPQLKNNKTHKIYAYALNGSGSGTNIQLSPGRKMLCPAGTTVLYKQPSVTSSVASRVKTVYENFPLPPNTAVLPHGKTHVVFWRWMSPTLKGNISALNTYTGFTPPSALVKYQLAPSPLTPNVTAVQWYKTTVGMVNIAASTPHRGDIMPITVQQTFDPYRTNLRPWRSPQYELAYSHELQIPVSDSTNAINYAQSYVAVIDETTQKWFWIGATAFDSRPGIFQNDIYSEYDYAINPYVNNPIVSSSYLNQTSYTHIQNGSATTTSVPWTGFRRFEFRMSYGELQQAITDIKAKFPSHAAMSINPANYKLYGVFFLSEVYHNANQPSGKLGLSVRNIQVNSMKNRAR